MDEALTTSCFVKMAKLGPAIESMLLENYRIRLTVTGNSMYPFLRSNRDQVELVVENFSTISRGDIVLIKRDTGQYLLHRVFRKNAATFFINGDMQKRIEGPFHPEHVIAKVTLVIRGTKQIDVQNSSWRFLSSLWMWFLPVRYSLLKLLGILVKIMKFSFKNSLIPPKAPKTGSGS
jgi:signal peptidase I